MTIEFTPICLPDANIHASSGKSRNRDTGKWFSPVPADLSIYNSTIVCGGLPQLTTQNSNKPGFAIYFKSKAVKSAKMGLTSGNGFKSFAS
jgi:hypothetical protein